MHIAPHNLTIRELSGMQPTFKDKCVRFADECLRAASSGWAGGLAFMALMMLAVVPLFVG